MRFFPYMLCLMSSATVSIFIEERKYNLAAMLSLMILIFCSDEICRAILAKKGGTNG